MGIVDIQLMPTPYPGNDTELFETVNMRLTRFKYGDSPSIEIDARDVLRALCTYLLGGEDCNHVKSVLPVQLDGDTKKESHHHSNEDLDYYIIDTYEISFD